MPPAVRYSAHSSWVRAGGLLGHWECMAGCYLGLGAQARVGWAGWAESMHIRSYQRAGMHARAAGALWACTQRWVAML